MTLLRGAIQWLPRTAPRAPARPNDRPSGCLNHPSDRHARLSDRPSDPDLPSAVRSLVHPLARLSVRSPVRPPILFNRSSATHVCPSIARPLTRTYGVRPCVLTFVRPPTQPTVSLPIRTARTSVRTLCLSARPLDRSTDRPTDPPPVCCPSFRPSVHQSACSTDRLPRTSVRLSDRPSIRPCNRPPSDSPSVAHPTRTYVVRSSVHPPVRQSNRPSVLPIVRPPVRAAHTSFRPSASVRPPSSASPFAPPIVCPNVPPSVRERVRLFFRPPVRPSDRLCNSPPVRYLCPSFRSSLRPSVRASVRERPSVRPSVRERWTDPGQPPDRPSAVRPTVRPIVRPSVRPPIRSHPPARPPVRPSRTCVVRSFVHPSDPPDRQSNRPSVRTTDWSSRFPHLNVRSQFEQSTVCKIGVKKTSCVKSKGKPLDPQAAARQGIREWCALQRWNKIASTRSTNGVVTSLAGKGLVHPHGGSGKVWFHCGLSAMSESCDRRKCHLASRVEENTRVQTFTSQTAA